MVPVIEVLAARYDRVHYGILDCGALRIGAPQNGAVPHGAREYPLFALKSRDWNPALPCALVTGGVHPANDP